MEQLIHVQSISYSYPVNADDDDLSENDPHEKKSPEQELPGPQGAEVAEKALDGVCLEAERGQFICILGSNGSGKSTLARHLNALLVPDEGTVWIGGLDTRDEKNLWDIRSKVGMVFQNPDNQMVASQVDEEVAFGLENIGVPSEQIRADVKDAIKAVGMDGFEKENPYYLSGGQKQRIAIAGILAMKPACVVLDESTSMLDPRGRQEIMDMVTKLHREYGITIICITHFMEEALDADRVFVMHQGKVLLQGTAQQIFADRSTLEKAGLRLPAACQLAVKLRELGMEIPSRVITADALVKFIQDSC